MALASFRETREVSTVLAAFGLALASYAGTSVLLVGLKLLGSTTDPWFLLWGRYGAHFGLMLLFLRPWQALAGAERLELQLLRGILFVLTTILNIAALDHLQLAEIVALNFATPFLVTLGAALLLGEPVGLRRWATIMVGFTGVVIVTRPDPSGIEPAMLLPLGAAFCAAGYYLLTRQLLAGRGGRSDASAMLVITVGVAVLITSAGFVAHPDIQVLEFGPKWLFLIGLGAIGFFTEWSMSMAIRRAPAAVLAPCRYSQILSTALLAFLVFGEVPDAWTICGIIIIAATGLYAALLENAPRLSRAGGFALRPILPVLRVAISSFVIAAVISFGTNVSAIGDQDVRVAPAGNGRGD